MNKGVVLPTATRGLREQHGAPSSCVTQVGAGPNPPGVGCKAVGGASWGVKQHQPKSPRPPPPTRLLNPCPSEEAVLPWVYGWLPSNTGFLHPIMSSVQTSEARL
ncbi:unnamed protein product [Boreogadus saida]